MSTRKTADYAKMVYGEGELQYSSKAEKVRLEKIVKLVGTGNKVLDIGCYNGIIGSILIKNGNEVYGIEINPQVAENARQKGLKVKIQDIENQFDFEDNFFDVVVAAEIIEHILDTDFFINEIKRVLKPKGVLILSTPNVASLGRRIFLLLGENPYFEASFGYPPKAHAGHIRFFTKDLLFGYLKYKGFEIIKFTSDVVNFTSSGKIVSKLFAYLFPTFGRSLIVRACVSKYE
ncbi:MAG: methyltransferase domain-containing protein [Desulfobacteraceae bacterium]|nr:methyltransferase domain-containing protein [Desulfobacteraceae bacterium]